ncbi:hypothetical protein [Paenibacillus sabinae]|uniref:2,3-dihydroxybenzoate-AMP ligase n=1 Tax=Paenibacillus sabinae T27 TaxID=1268072 RepID=X4ZV13_9BACL|nr:hypothetical protein [Paenibacillus sabinae]AHV96153.1 2,3-dihydroxybenzoate-AMP ligase [Paenibacillus sabinae T27]
MNRHYFEGYQRVFTNDINDIEKQLQEYDPDLYVMWRPSDNTWLIMDGLLEIAIMKIPQVGFSTLDARVYRRIREIHVHGFSAQQVIKEAEEKHQREQDRLMEDLAYDFAKESKEAFINAYDYGRTSGITKYVNGGV